MFLDFESDLWRIDLREYLMSIARDMAFAVSQIEPPFISEFLNIFFATQVKSYKKKT